MSEILIRHASLEGSTKDILVRNGVISAIANDLVAPPDVEVFDAEGLLVWPGMVNTHHHLAQSILKGMPSGINSNLNDWLIKVPFSAWPHFDAETMYVAAMIGFSELLRSGCTTCADHHYLYQKDYGPELESAVLSAAEDIGIRFVLCRGGATSTGSHLGLTNSGLIVNEDLDTMLLRLQDTLHNWHDPTPESMRRLVVAPTSLVHGAEPDHLRVLAEFAVEHDLRRHSHLLEVKRDEEITQQKYGMSAASYAEDVGWLGPDVWYAHLVHTDEDALAKFAESGTGIAHCPTSNCRLGSGIAPVVAMAAAGIPVSLGVDGSASAESGSMANEAMLTWLLHRAIDGASSTSLDQVKQWSTLGGANILGLNIGRISIGACADLIFFDLSEPRYAGLWMPEYAPIVCGEPVQIARTMINGRWRVIDGQLVDTDIKELLLKAEEKIRGLSNRIARV